MGEQMQVYTRKRECYGCAKCKQTCPVNAITMVRDAEGFVYPIIDEKRCIKCHKCIDTCINNMADEKKVEITSAVACSALNQEILKRSTSGGIFYLLACAVLEEDGAVYGASYVEGKVEHVRVEKIEDLHRMQGTKYVQSTIEKILPELEKDIQQNRKVLFAGTPCQVAAVRSLHENEKDNLLLVELFCMGVPAPQVWEDYIAEKESEWGHIINLNYRDKRTGWMSSSIVYRLENDENIMAHNEDIFMSGFSQALYMRPSCHDCRFKGANTKGDLKIGDFWGAPNFNYNYEENTGVSIVLEETENGKHWLSKISSKIQKEVVPYSFVLVYNPYEKLSRQPSKKRKDFFENYKEYAGKISDLIEDYLEPRYTSEQRKACHYPVVEGLLKLKNSGESSEKLLLEKGWKRIAIYGLGILGKFLIEDLKGSSIEIECVLDKNRSKLPEKYEGIDVIGPHEICEREYDGIVVSVPQNYNTILEILYAQDVDLNKVISITSFF